MYTTQSRLGSNALLQQKFAVTISHKPKEKSTVQWNEKTRTCRSQEQRSDISTASKGTVAAGAARATRAMALSRSSLAANKRESFEKGWLRRRSFIGWNLTGMPTKGLCSYAATSTAARKQKASTKFVL